MKHIISILLALLPISVAAQTDNKKLVDSLKFITEVPYINNCYNPIFWKIVSKGKEVVPALIDKMTDTQRLKEVYVPMFGGEYTVADVAYQAMGEIIKGIPTFELLGVPFSEDCGYCSYWFHVRESKKNRKKFQQAVRQWYELNKDNLMWVESTMSLTSDCFSPVGGHFEIKKIETSTP